MQDSVYLGDLGGLSARRQLIVLDLRGTGRSIPADPASYRCDRLVDDVGALQDVHLGMDSIDTCSGTGRVPVSAECSTRSVIRAGYASSPCDYAERAIGRG